MTVKALKTALEEGIGAAIMAFAGVGGGSLDTDLPNVSKLKSAGFGYELFSGDYETGPLVRVAVFRRDRLKDEMGWGSGGTSKLWAYRFKIVGVGRPNATQQVADAESALIEQILELNLTKTPLGAMLSGYTAGGKMACPILLDPENVTFEPSNSGAATGTTRYTTFFTQVWTIQVEEQTGT